MYTKSYISDLGSFDITVCLIRRSDLCLFDSLDLVWIYRLFFVFVTQVKPQDAKPSSAAPGGLQHTLEERISMYKIALENCRGAGEPSKVRRYERGLKVSLADGCLFGVHVPHLTDRSTKGGI